MPRFLMVPILAALFLTMVVGCTLWSIQSPMDEDEMQLVHGATYRMGTDQDELDDIQSLTGLRSTGPLLVEVPGHSVTVRDFLMDTFDVTNQEYAEFVNAVPKWRKAQADPALHNGRYLEHWDIGIPPDELLSHPVTFITWQSAVAYCRWRDKRLPTEAEFEWAAQDGKTREEYPWGNTPPSDDLVNWGRNGIETTVPVGSYPPNDRGLYDMSGNVWHFTVDPWLGSYAEMLDAPADDRQAKLNPNIRRVVKGGSWGANAANLRVRYRDSHRPLDAREMVGFRCAKSIDTN